MAAPFSPTAGEVLALDPHNVLIGIGGAHFGRVCIREKNGEVRPASPKEVSIAAMQIPTVRRLVEVYGLDRVKAGVFLNAPVSGKGRL